MHWAPVPVGLSVRVQMSIQLIWMQMSQLLQKVFPAKTASTNWVPEWAHVRIQQQFIQRIHCEYVGVWIMSAMHVEEANKDVNLERQQDSWGFGDMGRYVTCVIDM